MKPYELIRSLLRGNRTWEQFPILLARVSLGVFFAVSGGNKLFVAGCQALHQWAKLTLADWDSRL